MAKPPTRHLETAKEYERRLLRCGWYDQMPDAKRIEAEHIANGYGI